MTEVKNDRIGHSLRTPFPAISNRNQNNDKELISMFVERVQELIKAKCSEDIVRLGLCACGFVDRASQGASISSYFSANTKSKPSVKSPSTKKSSISTVAVWNKSSSAMISKQKATLTSMLQELNPSSPNNKALTSQKVYVSNSVTEISSKQQGGIHSYNGELSCSKKLSSSTNDQTERTTTDSSSVPTCNLTEHSPDLAYAMKLQASYDRENEILSKTENRIRSTSRKKGVGFTSLSQQRRKKARIDSFFKIKK